jgi:hypothetical protein
MSHFRTLVAASGCLIAVSCGPQGQSVPINTGDSTPPVVFSLETLGRQGGDLRVSQTSGPASGTLSATDSIAVAGRVDDPDGVKGVAIWGTEKKTCIDPVSGLGTTTGPGLAGVPLIESTDTQTSGTTTNQRAISTPVRVSDYSCPQGQKLSFELVFWATGQNYGGGTAQSAQLTLTFAAP